MIDVNVSSRTRPSKDGLATNVLTIRAASSDQDIKAVVEFRQRMYGNDPFYDREGDAVRDAAGFVWMAMLGGRLAAVGRAVPYSSGLGRLGAMGAPLEELNIDATWLELQALVADPSLGRGSGKLLMQAGLKWLYQNTLYTGGFAACKTALVPYYRKCGFEVFDDQFTVRGVPGAAKLHLLRGELANLV